MRRDIVVVGASAGGVPALERFVAQLPSRLNVSIFVVLHVSSHGLSVLPSILSRSGPLPAAHAVDGEPIEPGRIYVAPPSAHLLLEPGRVRLGQGPPENGVRPAIDVLFRSAAYVYRGRVVGVVLSGTLDDGTAGLWVVKRRGGLAVVQDPAEAAFASMPRSAVENVAVDFVLGVDAIGQFVAKLPLAPPLPPKAAPEAPMVDDDEGISREVAVATDPTNANPLEFPYGPEAQPARLACPSCHGTLWEIQEDRLTRYRCQVGHAFSSAALIALQNRDLEDALWTACRTLEESATLARRLAARAASTSQLLAQQHFEAKAKRASERAGLIRRALLAAVGPAEPARRRDAEANAAEGDGLSAEVLADVEGSDGGGGNS